MSIYLCFAVAPNTSTRLSLVTVSHSLKGASTGEDRVCSAVPKTFLQGPDLVSFTRMAVCDSPNLLGLQDELKNKGAHAKRAE